ncbi:hypothetical protein LQ564_05195 [Massilia sp. G4R7]|uniref:Uncharacterized protein n=1 Tax=Massilia phyllostachyos TaxID=2898585 RepID=A0ABS8Q1U3_9BURK|nr:hypothetical protein [Massilia phyllostachyos]MCD2515706.1 hypothetical protein [Massilia phyllostachyos]
MGYSIAWILVRGKTKEDILAQLGLADAGERDDFVENQVAVAALPGGAYLLCFNDMAHPATQAASMARVSKGCEALGCQVEENVMASAAFFYKDGAKVWDVVHLADQGLYHLEVNGAPPALLDTIHSEMKAAQDEDGGEGAQVDWLFEVPLMLATALGGYRHDEGLLSGEALVFTALAPVAPAGSRH